MAFIHQQFLQGQSRQPRQGRGLLTLELWRGRAVAVHVALYDSMALAGLDNLVSLTLTVKAAVDAPAALITQTVTEFTPCTAGEWAARTKQHATFQLSNAVNNIPATGESYWLVLTALTTSGATINYGTGRCFVTEDGADVEGLPPANGEPAISATEAAALVNAGLGGLLVRRADSGNAVHFFNSTTGAYQGSIRLVNLHQDNLEF